MFSFVQLKSAVNVLEQATDLNAINPPQNVSVKTKVEKEIFIETLTIHSI